MEKKKLSLILWIRWTNNSTLTERLLRQTLVDIDLRYEYIICLLNFFLKYTHPF